MIEWIPHDDGCRMPPETIGCVVRAMEHPTSRSVAETGNYISVDYISKQQTWLGAVSSVLLYHFSKVNDIWIPCMWEDLSDKHRLTIRTDQYVRRYIVGEYKDHRYYTLEALT